MAHDLEKIGRHFIVGLAGPELLDEEVRLLKLLQPLGVIVFSRNVDRNSGSCWPERLSYLLERAKDCSQRVRFIASIDHEGGRVHRLALPVTHFPPARNWAADAYEVGRTMGRELRSLGFNLNYAPVLDIHSQPANTVIGTRAFGTTASEVIHPALEFIRGQQHAGVLACGKHFPGHGDTRADSHEELPILDCSAKDLTSREFLPFKAAIDSGSLHLLMTAHVLYPSLDPDLPATLSKNILSDLLRRNMGYQNALISDDLGMKALNEISISDRAKCMMEASVDLLLAGNIPGTLPISGALELAECLIDLLNRGDLEEKCLDESTGRIDRLLNTLDAVSFSAEH